MDPTRPDFLLGWVWVQYQDLIKKSGRVGITQDPVRPDPFAGLVNMVDTQIEVLNHLFNFVLVQYKLCQPLPSTAHARQT